VVDVGKAVCKITGEAAKYKDPHTGIPYGSLFAYKALHPLGQQSGGRTTATGGKAEAVGPQKTDPIQQLTLLLEAQTEINHRAL
jgi:hypothetical protein